MSTEPFPDSATFVSAFSRGLRVIEAFGPGHTRMTLADAAQRTGLDRAVTRRLLLTLVELGLATTDGKQFELTPRVLRLGYSYLGALGLDERLRPDLDALSTAVGEATSVGILDGAEVVLVARSEAAALPFIYAPRIGTRLPAFASSSGRVMLSAMPTEVFDGLLGAAHLVPFTRETVVNRDCLRSIVAEARRDGFAVNVGETNEGVLSVSVPLRSRDDRVVAALSVSSHVQRRTREAMIEGIVPAMKVTASNIRSLLL